MQLQADNLTVVNIIYHQQLQRVIITMPSRIKLEILLLRYLQKASKRQIYFMVETVCNVDFTQ